MTYYKIFGYLKDSGLREVSSGIMDEEILMKIWGTLKGKYKYIKVVEYDWKEKKRFPNVLDKYITLDFPVNVG